MSTIAGANRNEWPKNFYEQGSTYGFINPNKIQSGVLQGTLTGGTGGPIFGNGQIVIPQSSGPPIIFNSGGISGFSAGGGPVLSIIITSPSVHVTGIHSPGDPLNASDWINAVIPHELGFLPAMQNYVVIASGSLIVDPLRPWNNADPTLTPNDIGFVATTYTTELANPWYLVPSLLYSDTSLEQNADGAYDCCYIAAGVGLTSFQIFGARFSGGSSSAYDTPERTFVINFYPLLGSNVLDF